MLGAGFRSVAIATAEGHVFRIARNAAAAAGYARERRLLPVLRPYLPVPIPDPCWVAGPSAAFPYGVMGYPLLPGKPLAPADSTRGEAGQLAVDLAAFLRALHTVPLALTAPLDLPGPADRQARWAQIREATLPPLRVALSMDEYAAIARWWDQLLPDPIMAGYTPVVHHGDFWYENILVDDPAQRVMSIVDFEDAALGDPAQDFATLRHLGDPFAAQVLAAYQAAGAGLDATFAYRMERLWELREFEGLHFALRTADPAEVADAIGKLRRGPLMRGP